MANSIFRAFPIYVEGKKVAEAMSSTYDTTDSGTNQVGLDGVEGQSDGVIESKIDFDVIVPVQGTTIKFSTYFFNRARVTIGIPIDGGYDSVEGKLTGRSYSSDSKTGECKGKWSFIGGEPQRVEN